MMEAALLQIGQALLIVVVALLLLRLARQGFVSLESRAWMPPTFVVITGNVVRWLIWLTAGLLVFELFGLPLKTVWAGLLSAVLVIAVAFVASWSVLSNMLASMVLITFSRIRVGDIVELRETKRDEVGMRGRIVDINLFFVTLQELIIEPDVAEEAATTQVPCHLFFYRVTRCWPGKKTQSLRTVFNEEHPPRSDSNS